MEMRLIYVLKKSAGELAGLSVSAADLQPFNYIFFSAGWMIDDINQKTAGKALIIHCSKFFLFTQQKTERKGIYNKITITLNERLNVGGLKNPHGQKEL
jgi:hypothetical protein